MMDLKHWLVAFLGMAMIWGLAPKPHQVTAKPQSPAAASHVIRFRVIANSDNPVDQAIKLDVRDAILEKLDPVLNGVKNRKTAASRIRTLEPELSHLANQVLTEHHAAYGARVEWTRTDFPTKAYGSWVLPAGRYQALLIVLGKGAGHNWWCVLYPSLCFIDMGNALAVTQTPTVPAPEPSPTAPASSVPPTSSTSHVHQGKTRAGTIHVVWRAPKLVTTILAILDR